MGLAHVDAGLRSENDVTKVRVGWVLDENILLRLATDVDISLKSAQHFVVVVRSIFETPKN